jgi:hypothetical protein
MRMDIFMVKNSKRVCRRERVLVMEAAGMGSIHGIVVSTKLVLGFESRLHHVWHFSSLEG